MCHLRKFMEEVAEGERHAVLTSIQHFFHHTLIKHSDRATPELRLSITSPEMHLPQRAKLSHRATNNLLGRTDGSWGRAGIPNFAAPDPTCQPLSQTSSLTANNGT